MNPPAAPRLAVDGSMLSVYRTGIENYFHHLLPYLTRLWSGDQDPAGRVVVFARDPGVVDHVEPRPAVVPGGGRGWTQLRLPQALRRARAAVYFSPIPILPLLLPMPCPAVVTVHDLHEFRPRWSYYRRLVGRTLRRAAGVVCVSDSSRQELIEEFPWAEPRCRVVREAADAGIYHPPTAGDPAGALARFGLEHPPLLAVGTLQPRKNYARLIRAYSRLGPDAPPLLIVGGRGWDFEEIVRLPAELGIEARVKFAGHVREEDLGDLMRASRMLCAVSTAEGFGLPLVEAMYCGLPILASDIPPFREVAGNAARFVDPGSVDAISAGLSAMLGDAGLTRTLAEVGLARRMLFSWSSAAESIVGLLRSVL